MATGLWEGLAQTSHFRSPWEMGDLAIGLQDRVVLPRLSALQCCRGTDWKSPSPLCLQNKAGESSGQGARPAPEPCRTFVVLTEIKRRSQRPETRETQVGHKESSGEKESSRMCC